MIRISLGTALCIQAEVTNCINIKSAIAYYLYIRFCGALVLPLTELGHSIKSLTSR